MDQKRLLKEKYASPIGVYGQLLFISIEGEELAKKEGVSKTAIAKDYH